MKNYVAFFGQFNPRRPSVPSEASRASVVHAGHKMIADGTAMVKAVRKCAYILCQLRWRNAMRSVRPFRSKECCATMASKRLGAQGANSSMVAVAEVVGCRCGLEKLIGERHDSFFFPGHPFDDASFASLFQYGHHEHSRDGSRSNSSQRSDSGSPRAIRVLPKS